MPRSRPVTAPLIVAFGEALVDLLPDGPVVGGAPLNLTVHAAALGNRAALISRVGSDPHGGSVLECLAERGVSAAGVQLDEEWPTGTVGVELDGSGEPRYGIHEGVAWDRIEYGPSLAALVQRADALVFGSLAARTSESRGTLLALLDQASPRTRRVLDLNLRAPFFHLDIVGELLDRADACKVNAHELEVLEGALGHRGPELVEAFSLDWLAVTQGAEGARVLAAGGGEFWVDGVATSGPGDSVGAGDAFCAGILHGRLREWPWERSLDLAARLGSFVASSRGALPVLPGEFPGS